MFDLTRHWLGYPATFHWLGGGAKNTPQSNFRTNGRRETEKTANESSQQDKSEEHQFLFKQVKVRSQVKITSFNNIGPWAQAPESWSIAFSQNASASWEDKLQHLICNTKVKVRSPKVITNYLFNHGVCAAHDLWVILFIECNSETQKVISVDVTSRSGRYQVHVRSK